MFQKYDLNGVNLIKPKDWTLQNGYLKANLLHVDNLNLIKNENIKLPESIVNVIKLWVYQCCQNYLITL